MDHHGHDMILIIKYQTEILKIDNDVTETFDNLVRASLMKQLITSFSVTSSSQVDSTAVIIILHKFLSNLRYNK